MKYNKAFKYRIYPNDLQMVLIEKTFGCCRFIYNKMLSDKMAYYKKNKKTLKITPASYKKEYEWLKEIDSLALCNASQTPNLINKIVHMLWHATLDKSLFE